MLPAVLVSFKESDYLELQKMEKYLCKNCKYKKHQCYVCGKLGTSDETLGGEREVSLNFQLVFGCRAEQNCI